MFLDRDGVQLHLSEHTGDARPGTLVYFWVENVDAIAVEFGAEIKDQPWGREIKLTDPTATVFGWPPGRLKRRDELETGGDRCRPGEIPDSRSLG